MARDYARSNRSSSRRSREESSHNWRWPLAGILIALFAAGIFFLKQQSDKLAAEQGDQGGSIIQRTMKPNVAETSSSAPSKTNAKKSTAAGSAGSSQQAEPQTSPPPQPKFDFYSMLPQGQVATSSTNKTNAPPTSAPASTSTTPAALLAKPTTSAPPVTKQPQPSTTPAPATAPPPSHTSASIESKRPSPKQLEQKAQADTSDLIAAEIQKLGTDNTSKAKADTNSTKKTSHYIVQLGVFKNYNDADQLKAQLVLQGYEIAIKSFKKQSTLYRVYMGPYPSLATAKKQQHLLEQNQIKSKIAKDLY